MLDTKISSTIYERVKEDRDSHPYVHWHASSIAECPKSHYLKRKHIPPYRSVGAGKLLRWKAGHIFEEAVRPYLGEVTSNKRFTSRALDLTGEYDNYREDIKALVEIKTVHPAALKEKKTENGTVVGLKKQIGFHPNGNRKWDIKEHPYLHHLLQQHCYVKLMAEEGIEVEQLVFVYIALDGRVVTYREEVDQMHLDEVDRRLKILNDAWESQTPPECLCHETNHPLYDGVMQWCDYREGDKCCELKEA